MPSIRDEEIRSLAEVVMKKRGAPNLAAAIKLALENEVRRSDDATPLRDRVAALRDEARATADRTPLPPLTKDERDSLWGL